MRSLSTIEQKELLCFLAIATLFVFPLIQANVTFADDTTRVIVGYPGWAFLGRPLATLISAFSSLGWVEKGILDIGVWSQIMAAALLALSAFVFNQYLKRQFHNGIFWLAAILIINPYFLYNLSYRFDALAMTMGLFCTVYAFSLPIKHSFGSFKSILLLIAALSFYQSDINLFIALTAIELILYSDKNSWAQLIKNISVRAAQYAIALVVYYLSIAKIFMANNHGRNNLVSLDSAGLENLADNIGHYLSLAGDFFSPPIIILMAVFILYSVFHFLPFALKHANKKVLLSAPLLAALMYCVALSGPMFLLAENTASYRTMPAYFTFVALFISLSYIARKQFSYSWLIPVYIAITLSFQYGIALKTQRDFEVSISTMIYKDLLTAKLDNSASYVDGGFAQAPRAKNLAASHQFIQKSAQSAGGWVARALLIGQGIENVVFQWPHEYEAYEATLTANFCASQSHVIAQNSQYSIYNSNGTNLILLGKTLSHFCKT